MMAVMVAILMPRAHGQRRAGRAGARHRAGDRRPAVARSTGARHGSRASSRRQLRLSGQRDAQSLSDLSFTLEPGETSAIIGGTGSGKTTLLNLIPRFFDASSGTVLVNGVDVRDQEQESSGSSIGLVPQAAFLFSGTVASNLRFGRPTRPTQELWRALEIAQARDFVAAMPGRSRRSDRPGRHQRLRRAAPAPVDRAGPREAAQRLPVRRLLLGTGCRDRRPAASGAEGRRPRDAAVVIVAQRVSTIMHADRIIVLDDGRVAGMGTHDELLTNCLPYREIVRLPAGRGAAA